MGKLEMRKLVQRKRIQAYAASALISLAWIWALGASAQGIDLEAVHRYGYAGNLVGELRDYGYERARDISRLVTAVSFVIALFVPMDKKKESNLMLVAIELVALACIPILVHIIGTYFIDNYDNYFGLGGRL